MNAQCSAAPDLAEARHVEVLTSPFNGQIVGYKFVGARPGPTLLVAGHAPHAGLIFDRLMDLPTLPWLRGTLCLLMLEAFDPARPFDAGTFVEHGPIDDILFLPFAGTSPDPRETARDGYWTVLRRCGQLGMIDGRGVLQRR